MWVSVCICPDIKIKCFLRSLLDKIGLDINYTGHVLLKYPFNFSTLLVAAKEVASTLLRICL